MNKLLTSALLATLLPVSFIFSQGNYTFSVNVWQAIQNQQATVTHTQTDIGSTGDIFDGNFNTLARSANVNPFVVTLVFDYTINVSSMSTMQNNGYGWWTVEAANSVADLDNHSGSYQVLFSQSPLAQDVIATLPVSVSKKAFRLTMQRTIGDNYVHLWDWGIVATATVQITDLSFQPNQVRLIKNASFPVTLAGVDNLGNTYPLTSGVTWNSSNPGAATVNPGGVMNSFSNTGETTLTGSWNGLSKSTNVKVVDDFTMPLAPQRTVKVALVIIDPPIPAAGGQRFSQVHWSSWYGSPHNFETLNGGTPQQLANQVRDSMTAVSDGVVTYQFVETHNEPDLFFTFGGTAITVDSLYHLFNEPGWTTLHLVAEQQSGSVFQYNELLNKYDFCTKSNNKQIDEIWVYAMPFIGMWEANMTGTGAFWINGPVLTGNSCTDLLPIMGFNYERTYDLALHNFGHRIETTMYKTFGTSVRYVSTDPPYQPGVPKNTLQKFMSFDLAEPGDAHVGNVHFPPNAIENYGYYNTGSVTSYEQNWKRYPFLFQQTRNFNCTDWDCSHDGFMRWWLRRIPKFKCKDKDGFLNNWWAYVIDYNEGKSMEAQVSNCDCEIFSDSPPPPANYCQSYSNFPWEDWIAKVKVGSIDNASGKTPYSNFTNLSTNLNTGSTPVELTTGFSYFTFDEYWRVWIDLNQDGDFDDPGELVFQGIKNAPPAGTPTGNLTGNLNIPASALTGPTRMRVSMKRGAYATPCETLPFGEVEDYTVNVTGSGPSCNVTFATGNVQCQDNGTPDNPGDDTFTFEILVTGTGISQNWQMTWPGGSASGLFSVVKTIGPLPISAFSGGLVFTVFDNANPSCSATGSLTPPPPCSTGPSVCGFSENYPAGPLMTTSGFFVEEVPGGFFAVGSSPMVPTGLTFVEVTTDVDGNQTSLVTKPFSAAQSTPPIWLRDGNVLFVNSFQGQITISKQSGTGGIIWGNAFIIPGAVNFSIGKTVETPAGDIVVTGLSYETSPPQLATTKLFALKLNSQGQQQGLTLSTPTGLQNLPTSIFQLKAGPTGDFYFTLLTNAEQKYVGKLSADGALQWTSFLGGIFTTARQVEPGMDGSVLVSFTQTGGGGPTYTSVGWSKFSADGNLMWGKSGEGLSGLTANPMFLPYGNPIAAAVPGGGYTVSFTAPPVNSPAGFYLVGLSPTGSVLWSKKYTTDDLGTFPVAGFMKRTNDGGYLLTGSQDNHLWLMKTDGQGNICTEQPPADYCTSSSDFPWEEWIAKVELGNFQNASGKSTYSDFTNQVIDVTAGQSYPIQLTTGFSYFTWDEYWTVWIDFNHDGVFSSPNEVVQMQKLTAPAAGTPTATITGSVNIPAGTLTGPTRMRVSMKRGAYATACEILPFGEVEDYTINISSGGGGCSITASTSNIQCQDNGTPQYPLDDRFTFSVLVSGTNAGSQWQMTWSGGSTTGTYGQAKIVGPLSIATFQNGFNFTITDAGNSNCTTTGSVTPPPPCSNPQPGNYCASQGDFPWHEWIARVKLNTLDNTSGKSQYSDFTGLSTTLQKGQSYPVTLTTGFSYFTWDEYWRVWIDYNHDGVFSTPDEVVQQQILTAPAAGTATASVTGSINIAVGALTGTTRMRVSMKRGGFASSCETFANGEVEDYTINITSGLNGGDIDNRAEGISFEAVPEISHVRLYGAYYQEEGVAEVIFEKSTNGENFMPLESQSGKTSAVVQTVDAYPVEGFNYYRLFLHLTGGEVKISPVRVVSFVKMEEVTLFPNPATNEVYLYFSQVPVEGASVQVYDAQGKSLLTENIGQDAGLPYRIDVNGMEEGIYFLLLQRKGKRAIGRRLVIVR